MVGMKLGETTKWANIAFDRGVLLKSPTSSMPNVNLTACPNATNEHCASDLLHHQRYRTELSLNIGDYSYVSKHTKSVRSIDIEHVQIYNENRTVVVHVD
jgi:hypothetical protein